MELPTRIALAFVSEFPAEVATELESHPSEFAAGILAELPEAEASRVLRNMSTAAAAQALESLPDVRPIALFRSLPLSRSAAIFRVLDPTKRESWLGGIPESEAEQIRGAARFEPDTAGALMEPVALALLGTATIGSARRAFRRSEIKHQPIYLVDDDMQLTGTVEIAAMVGAEAKDLLESIQVESDFRIQTTASFDRILDDPVWSHSTAVPVVDRKGRLQGVLTTRAIHKARSSRRAGYAESRTVSALGELFRIGLGGFADAIAPVRSDAEGSRS